MENTIKEYRKALGLTQVELGQKVGTSGANISSWEVGRTEPNVGQAILLAKTFGCSVGDLFIDIEPEHSRSNAHLLAYCKKFQGLSREQSMAVESLIDNFVEQNERREFYESL